MKLNARKSLDDRAALVDAAHRYAEEIAASDLRELREQVAEAWTYAGDCLAAFARHHSIVDADFSLSVVERAMEGALRRRLIEAEEAELWRELDAIDASEVDVRELLAYADAWDRDVASMREAVQEMAQEVER